MDIYHGYLNFDDITDMQAKRDNAFLYGCRSTEGLFCVRVYVEHDTQRFDRQRWLNKAAFVRTIICPF